MFCRALAILACLSSAVFAEDISLTDVWAWKMPGAKDIRELEPGVFGAEAKNLKVTLREKREQESLINQIERALSHRDLHKPALSGFAVSGNADDALRGAFDVLVQNQKPKVAFSSNDTIWIIFFTLSAGDYAQVTGATRSGNHITVNYGFITHRQLFTESYFALIPLGALETGKYEVKFVDTVDPDRTQQPESDKDTKRIVSGSFSFIVGRADL
jgi:hypothetical protein